MHACRSHSAPAAAVAALLVVLSACGGSDDAGVAQAAAVDVTTTQPSEPKARSTAMTLDVEVRYAGFLLALDELTVEDGDAVVTGTASNLGSTTSPPPSNVTIDLDGEAVALDQLASELPDVPGDSTGEVAYAFSLPADAELDDAVLLVGGADYARAEVPLGATGKLVANEPVAVAVTGEVVAGETTFHIEGGELSFDVPDEHEPAEAGQAFLTLRFAVTNNSEFAGGYPFAGEDLRLETPSGITLAPDEFPIELLQPISSLTDLAARWTIGADEPGTYTFIGLRDVGFADQAEGRLALQVAAAR